MMGKRRSFPAEALLAEALVVTEIEPGVGGFLSDEEVSG
jgi:hypothetical protein